VHSLYLLRHAKSSWADPGLADDERPLARRGRRDAKRVAAHLRRLGVSPQLLLCSPAERTRQTLELVRPALAPTTTVKLNRALYTDSAQELLEQLRAVSEDVASVMLIGHNPTLQELALLLVSAGPDLERLEAKFPTAALATLTIPRATWRSLSEADAELTAYVVPRELD
jgi:phosphohistidine phosphatase